MKRNVTMTTTTCEVDSGRRRSTRPDATRVATCCTEAREPAARWVRRQPTLPNSASMRSMLKPSPGGEGSLPRRAEEPARAIEGAGGAARRRPPGSTTPANAWAKGHIPAYSTPCAVGGDCVLEAGTRGTGARGTARDGNVLDASTRAPPSPTVEGMLPPADIAPAPAPRSSEAPAVHDALPLRRPRPGAAHRRRPLGGRRSRRRRRSPPLDEVPGELPDHAGLHRAPPRGAAHRARQLPLPPPAGRARASPPRGAAERPPRPDDHPAIVRPNAGPRPRGPRHRQPELRRSLEGRGDLHRRASVAGT